MKKPLKPRAIRLLVVLPLALLLPVACRADDARSPEAEDDGQAQTQGVSDDSIKIGMFGPLSGPAAVYSKGIESMIAIYEEVNDDGGINGRRLELVVEDDECDPTTVNLVVKKLVDSEEVFLLHGGMCSNAVINALPEIERSGVPFVVMAAAAAEVVDPPKRNVFAPWVSQPANTIAIAEYVISHLDETGGSRVAIVSQRDDWGTGWLTFLKRDLSAVAEREGVDYEIVADEEIAEQVTDATPQVRRVLDSDADVSVVFALPQPLSVYMRDAHAQGLAVPIVTGNAVEPTEQLERVGTRDAVSELVTTYCFGATLDSDEMEPYRQRFAARAPNDQFDGIAVSGVVGAEVIVHALTEMGDELTWDGFIAEMESVTGFESPTSPTPVSFAPFEANNPQTRAGAESCRLSALAPQGDGSEVVVFDASYAARQTALAQ